MRWVFCGVGARRSSAYEKVLAMMVPTGNSITSSAEYVARAPRGIQRTRDLSV
jgi:hypothetical protein